MRRWPRPRRALAPGSISTTTNARTRTSAIARGDKFTNCGDAHDRRCQPAALPASRASSESGEMLAFAHIPTGTVANKGFDIDEVKGRLAAPASAMTAIEADIETGGATP